MDHIVTKIIHHLNGKRNLDFSGTRESMLVRRISKRLNPTGSKSFPDYYAYLKTHPEELENLIQVLTINVSWFFREPLTFEILSKILNEMINEKIENGNKWLRVWSAGCSTGEEPYSVAMIIDGIMSRCNTDLQLNIFATDIDKNAIRIAKKGIYTGDAVRNVKQGQIAAYFSSEKDQFKLDPSIRKMVDFSYHDLKDKQGVCPPDSIFGNFDLILCRNVLIYFDPGCQEEILSKFYKSMNRDGYLVLGKAEVPTGHCKTLFEPENSFSKIYRKCRQANECFET